MKTITLIQPHATLVVLRAKRFETRGWSTRYRGPLAIHSAKNFPRWAKQLCADNLYLAEVLRRAGLEVETLPLGAVIAVGRLAGCYAIPQGTLVTGHTGHEIILPPPEPERSFGDYTPGRFAWFLTDIEPLPKPIPARGALGLWEWRAPAVVANSLGRTFHG